MQYKIFLSSPADVEPERDAFERVVARINNDHVESDPFELVRWEHAYYTADDTFQTQIEKPSECDLVVCVFWKRLGSNLPEEFVRPDGSVPTGTEYEFEEALQAAANSKDKLPDVLVYRKTAEVHFSEDNLEYEKAQRDRFLQFWRRWFRNEKGHFVAGFQSFSDTESFAQMAEAHLRRWLRNRSDAVVWTSGAPYRGLDPFDVEHAPIFFGRTRETERARARLLTNCLAGERFLLILGPSGSGKSSLARAGLIPRLAEIGGTSDIATHLRWAITSPMTIRANWAQGLAGALFAPSALAAELQAGDFDTEASLGDLLAGGGPQAVAPIRKALERAAPADNESGVAPGVQRAALLILVDQLEEIFAWPADDASAFLDTLAALALEGTAPVLVVATMRSDFQHRITEIPALERLVGKLELRGPDEIERSLELALPGPGDLHEMITGPARAASLTFDLSADRSRDLAQILELESNPAAMPAMQFLLTQLYARREDRLLTLAAYDELGGSGGVMATRGEEVLAGLDQAAVDAFDRVARALVTRTSADAPATALRVAEANFGEDTPEARLVAALKEASLLTSDRGEIRIAHESLIAGWKRLEDLIERERRLFESRERLVPYYRRYEDAPRSPRAARRDRLLTGFPLAEGRELLKEWGPEVLADTEAGLPGFIAASHARDTWRRRRNLLVGWAVSAVFAALAFLMYDFWIQADAARRKSDAALLAVQSQDLLSRGDTLGGVELAMKGLVLLPSDSTRSAALTALMEISPHLESAFPAKGGALAWANPDTLAVLSADDALQLRAVQPLAGSQVPKAQTSTLDVKGAIDFVAGLGRETLVLMLRDGTIRLARRNAEGTWQLEPGAYPAESVGGAGAIAAGASATANVVAVAYGEHTTVLRCPPEAGLANCAPSALRRAGAGTVALSGDVHWLAVGYGGETPGVAVYDLTRAGVAAPVAALPTAADVGALTWSAEGDQLAIGTYDRGLMVLDTTALDSGRLPVNLEETMSDGTFPALEWNPVEATLAFACGENEICVRRFPSATAGQVEQRFVGHRNFVSRMTWSADGTRLASVDDNNTVMVWRVQPDPRVHSVLETSSDSALVSVAIDPERKRIAAGDDSGNVWMWPGVDAWTAPRRLAPPPGVSTRAVSLAFAPDGALAVVHENAGITIRSRDGEGIERYAPIAGSVNRLAWIDGGERVAAAVQHHGRIVLVPRSGDVVTLAEPEFGLDPRSVIAWPGGNGFIANYTDGSMWRWSSSGERTGEPLVSAQVAGEGALGAMSLAFDAAGKRFVATREDNRMPIYDLSGKRAAELSLRSPRTVTVAFAPAGNLLAVLGSRGGLELWDVVGDKSTPRFSLAAAPTRFKARQSQDDTRRVSWITWWDESRILLPTAAGNVLVLDVDETHWLERASALGLVEP